MTIIAICEFISHFTAAPLIEMIICLRHIVARLTPISSCPGHELDTGIWIEYERI